MSNRSIIASWDENILRDAEVSVSVAAAASYSEADLIKPFPDERVLFGAGSATALEITFTLPEAREGAILVIPYTNADDEAVGAVSVLNDLALDQDVEVPPLDRTSPLSGWHNTIGHDMTLASPSTLSRTADVWKIRIDGTGVPVVMGGGIAIFGPKHQLSENDFLAGIKETEERAVIVHRNDYKSRYVQDNHSRERTLTITRRGSKADSIELRSWYRGSYGSVHPVFLWLDPPDLEHCLLCEAPLVFQREQLENEPNIWRVTMMLIELSKGEPLT